MSKLKQQPLFVQKLITSYFPASGTYPELLSLSTELDSLCCTLPSSSDSGYVSETPVSQQGRREWYLGKCNIVDESPRRALFVRVDSTNFCSSPTTSYDFAPCLSDGMFSIGSPTASCESVAFRK